MLYLLHVLWTEFAKHAGISVSWYLLHELWKDLAMLAGISVSWKTVCISRCAVATCTKTTDQVVGVRDDHATSYRMLWRLFQMIAGPADHSFLFIRDAQCII